MADLDRRRTSRPSRRRRRDQAYRMVVTSGILGIVAAVGIILAIAGVIGWLLPIFAAILSVLGFVLVRKSVSS